MTSIPGFFKRILLDLNTTRQALVELAWKCPVAEHDARKGEVLGIERAIDLVERLKKEWEDYASRH